jgi:hypothetical protein
MMDESRRDPGAGMKSRDAAAFDLPSVIRVIH